MSGTAKKQSSRTKDIFQTRLNLTTHMKVATTTPKNSTTLPVASMVGCTNKVDDPAYLEPIYINQSTDSFGLPIDGGTAPGDKLNVDTTKTGSRLITGILGKVRDHLPWVSKVYVGKGIQGGNGSTGVGSPPAYGTFPIPDPNNPGSYISAPGTADKIVNAPEIEVELLTVGGVDQSYLKFGGDDGNGLGVDTTALETKLKADGLGGGGSGGGTLMLAVESSAVGSFASTGNWLGNQNADATAGTYTGATPGGGININDGFLDLSTVDFDPHSIFDATTSTVTIPTGQGGWYRLEFLSTTEFDPRNSLDNNNLSYFIELYDTQGGSNAGAQIAEDFIWGGYGGATIPSAGTAEITLDYSRTFQLADGDSFQMEISCGCNNGNIKIDKSYMALYKVDTGTGLGSLPHYTWNKSASHTSSGFSQISLILDPSTDAVSGFTSTDPTSGALLFPAGTFILEGDAALSGLPSNSVVQVSVAGLRNDPSDTNQNVSTSASNIGGMVIPAPAPINRVVNFAHPWQPSVIVTATTLANPATDTFSVTGFDLMITQIGS